MNGKYLFDKKQASSVFSEAFQEQLYSFPSAIQSVHSKAKDDDSRCCCITESKAQVYRTGSGLPVVVVVASCKQSKSDRYVGVGEGAPVLVASFYPRPRRRMNERERASSPGRCREGEGQPYDRRRLASKDNGRLHCDYHAKSSTQEHVNRLYSPFQGFPFRLEIYQMRAHEDSSLFLKFISIH